MSEKISFFHPEHFYLHHHLLIRFLNLSRQYAPVSKNEECANFRVFFILLILTTRKVSQRVATLVNQLVPAL